MVDYEMCEYLAASVDRKAGSRMTDSSLALYGRGNHTLAAFMTTDAATSGMTLTPSEAAGDGDFMKTVGNLEEIKYYLYGYVTPIICGFGLLGNLLNIIVLTRRRMQAAMDSSMERTARYVRADYVCLNSLLVINNYNIDVTFTDSIIAVGC